MRTRFSACFVLILGLASVAQASPLLELTGGFGGLGALQARHASPSAASSYFNPALLPDAPAGLVAGVLVLNTNIGVRLNRRTVDAAVPDGLSSAFHEDHSRLASYPISTDFLQRGGAPSQTIPDGFSARPRQRAGSGDATHTYEAVGLVLHLFEKRLVVGFYGVIPNVNFTTFSTHYADEREQYFTNSLHPELYGDRLKALSFAFAAGARLTRSFSIGGGITVGLRASASAPVYVYDAGRLNELQLNLHADAKISLVPHAGIAWNPGRRWRVTAVVHAPQKNDVKGSFKFLLATGTEQGSGLGFAYDFQPWQVGAGLSYDIVQSSDLTWSTTGSLLYGRWSRYIDRHYERPDGVYRWSDTLTGALGTRLQKGALGIALDGQYRPTPVPKQTGRSNYVDNDSLGLALSLDYGFGVWGKRFNVGVQLQSARLLERYQRKVRTPTSTDGRNHTPQLVTDEVPDDAVIAGEPVAGRAGLQTNNPGWPGFSSQGWVSSAGLYLKMSL